MVSAIAIVCNGNIVTIIKTRSPTGFTEEYIIESIRNNRFPLGSILPAKHELPGLIDITRITLREVLQHLVHDDWLTVQHGKPIKVNNFQETPELSILETLACPSHDNVPQLIDNLLPVRTGTSTIFIRATLRQRPDKMLVVLNSVREVEDHTDTFADLDYDIFRGPAFASGSPIYGPIFNGTKGLHTRIGRHYFPNPGTRSLALGFYHQLARVCEGGLHDQMYELIRRHNHDSEEIWHRMQKSLPDNLAMNMR